MIPQLNNLVVLKITVTCSASILVKKKRYSWFHKALLHPTGISNMTSNNDSLVISSDKTHPANLIPELCRLFYKVGWVTGTG